jgi:hypothetical protein
VLKLPFLEGLVKVRTKVLPRERPGQVLDMNAAKVSGHFQCLSDQASQGVLGGCVWCCVILAVVGAVHEHIGGGTCWNLIGGASSPFLSSLIPRPFILLSWS